MKIAKLIIFRQIRRMTKLNRIQNGYTKKRLGVMEKAGKIKDSERLTQFEHFRKRNNVKMVLKRKLK